jgi:hypothetical protein
MPRVHFTPHLAKHIHCPPCEVGAGTLRDVLEQACLVRPGLAGYLLDDHQRLRQHVIIFIDNCVLRDRESLSDPVGPESQVFVMQALSGG